MAAFLTGVLLGATIDWLGSIGDDDFGLRSVAIFAARTGGYFVAAAALAELPSRGSQRRWMLLTAGLGSVVLVAVEFGVSTARYLAAFHSELGSGFIIAEVVATVFVRPAIFALLAWLQLWALLAAVARYRDSSTPSATDGAGV